MAVVDCTVNVQSSSMQCVTSEPAQSRLGVNLNLVIGGQERYIKLANSGNNYDSGTEIFRTDVTVQNLLQSAMGTDDGTTPTGITVFFVEGPVVTSGTGTVTVANADGDTTIYNPNVPFYRYDQVLQPYEISSPREWRFSAPPSVNTFTFKVYVSTAVSNELELLNAVWIGRTNDWFTGTNWSRGAVPGLSDVVTILADSTQNMPVLASGTSDAAVAALRLQAGTTLNLNGRLLQSAGTVDASGVVSNGRILMSGSTNSLLSGFVPALTITGSTSLQGPVRASGAVSVEGTLTVTDRTLTIQIP